MTDDKPDDFDDIPLHPVPPDGWRADLGDDSRADQTLRTPWLHGRKSGFGFWMAGLWCVLYLVVTQVIVGVGVGVIGAVVVIVQIANENNGDVPPPQVLNSDPRMITVMLISLACAHTAGILFSILMLRLVVGKTWRRRIALTRLPSLTHLTLVAIAFPALLGVVGILEEPVFKNIPSLKDLFDLEGLKEFMETLPSWPLWAAILTIAVMPGIGEELWCRGFLGQGTSARYGVIWSAVITSFYFGLIHVEPPQALFAVMLGFVIHGVYLATRSLPMCMAMHFANNACAVLHEGGHAKVLNPLVEVASAAPVLFVISASLLLTAVAYSLYQTRCKLAPMVPDMPTWEPKGVGGVELPPPNSGTIVAHDPLSPLSVALVLTGAVAFALVMAFA